MCRALGTGEKKSLRNFRPTKLAGQGGLLKLLCFSAELPIMLPALLDSFRASRAMSCEFPSPPSPVNQPQLSLWNTNGTAGGDEHPEVALQHLAAPQPILPLGFLGEFHCP